MSHFVIAAFKPKPGMQHALLAVVEKHWRVLQAQGLVTDRPLYAMQAGDGTIVEVFEWHVAVVLPLSSTMPSSKLTYHAVAAESEVLDQNRALIVDGNAVTFVAGAYPHRSTIDGSSFRFGSRQSE